MVRAATLAIVLGLGLGACGGGGVGDEGSPPRVPATISIDLAGLAATMAADEVAGFKAVSHWTAAAAGFAGFSGSIADLVDAEGVATTARIVWTTVSSQASGFIADAPGNARMMRGAIGGSGATTVVLDQLPATWLATGYDVYLYVRSADASTPIVTHTGISGATLLSKTVLALPAATFSPFTLATGSVPGNYIVFDNLTSSTFVLQSNGVITGIQIVPN